MAQSIIDSTLIYKDIKTIEEKDINYKTLFILLIQGKLNIILLKSPLTM